MTSLSVKGKTAVKPSFNRSSGLKIYSQNENPKNEASTMRKSTVGTKAAPLTVASDSKGTTKNMTNGKGKCDTSSDKIVQRKALADVSNLTSRTKVVYDGSKPMKNERNAILERVSVAPAARTVNVLSRRSFKGKETDHPIKGAAGVRMSNKEGVKDQKTSLNDLSITTKNSVRKPIVTTSRTTKSSLPPMRKSLPVLKKVNQAFTSDTV
ncbi:hypothetical protein PTKIN_Ptkin14bG0072800 [Pterospermum kingtungense]